MLLGLHLTRYVPPEGPPSLAPMLGRIGERAEQAGLYCLWPMDQLRQIPIFGEPDEPVLEAYTTLAWLAARTTHLQLGALVTAGSYRTPTALVKTVTTLDVLSGGRAWLGLGAAWGGRGESTPESSAPSVVERYGRLEELLQIAERMFTDDRRVFNGRYFHTAELLNRPLPIRRPPILIGGGGEQRTLRLVARYGDACNLLERIGTAALAHKLSILRQHCAELGRDYRRIAKTTFGQLGPRDLPRAIDRFAALSDLGVDLALVDLPEPTDDTVFDYLAELVNAVAPFGRAFPI